MSTLRVTEEETVKNAGKKTEDGRWFHEQMAHPPASCRSLPFWSWNGRMEEEEVRRQVNLLYQGGVGGFFMHAREGLETEYMGERWMSCILAAVREAKCLGLEAWLYDEDRWPSGGAAGRVCAQGQDAYRCKGLTMEVCGQKPDAPDRKYGPEGRLLAAYAASVSDDSPMELNSYRRIPVINGKPADSPDGMKETLLLLREEVSAPHEWFHGEAPPDLLNPDAVECFIRETHERYKTLLGDEFGGAVKGIFTDEPSLADRRAAFSPVRGWMPWTWGLEREFADEFGYDLLDAAPGLYFRTEGYRKVRHDYWKLISMRFSRIYSGRIGAWCEENGISYTGHFLQENKLGLCTRVNGAVMPHYRWQQVPGIDWLGEQAEEYVTVKQCAGVTAQMGRKTVLTETYAGTGWEFTMEGQKWIGDFQFALGANRRCQHLAFYSLKGMRKRDYPPSFHYNNTWWERNRAVEDYFARLSFCLTLGEPVRDLLVLHPASTAWSMLGTSTYGNPVRRNERDVPAVDALGDAFNDLLKTLCGRHYDFDLGDELILKDLAAVSKARLQVGRCCYRAVLVPPMDTMLESTWDLLEQYERAGGALIFMEPVPFLSEGRPAGGSFRLLTDGRSVKSVQEALTMLERLCPRRISVTGADGKEAEQVLYQLRRIEDGWILFLTDSRQPEPYMKRMERSRNTEWQQEEALYRPERLCVCLPGITGVAERWDLLEGAPTCAQEVRTEGGSLKLGLNLGPADSALFMIHGEKAAKVAGCLGKTSADLARTVHKFPETCPIEADAPGLLVLNRCIYRMEEGVWSEETEVWRAQKEIRERLWMRPTDQNGIEQRYRWAGLPHMNDGTPVELEFCFEVEEVPKKAFLVLEDPEIFEIFCNGIRVLTEPEGFFLDRAFVKIPLLDLKEGDNRLRLTCCYRNGTELEDCYLLGDFGVDERRHLTKMPESLQLGDWTKQGLPHYCGSISYCYHFEYHDAVSEGRVFFRIGDFAGACAAVTVNGRLHEVPWRSAGYFEVTDELAEGENLIKVRIYGTPRNMLGPFSEYEKGAKPVGCGAFHPAAGKKPDETWSSRGKGGGRTGQYQLEPYGLITPCCLEALSLL